jgi:AcrR family transcriptional regulator
MGARVTWANRAAEQSAPVVRRRRRAEEQTALIVDAARRLVTSSTDGFTIQELAQEAGVGLPTFYRHFPSKDHLLLALIGDLVADECAEHEERGRELSDPVARLRFYVGGVLSSLDDAGVARFATAEFLRLRQLFPDEMRQVAQPFTDLMLSAIREAAAVGTMDPSDAESDAALVTELVIAVYHRTAWGGRPVVAAEVADQVTQFVLHGLRAAER